MKKTIKILRLILKSIGVLLLFLVVFLAASIPYGKSTEDRIPPVGKKIDKLVLKGVNIIPMKTNEVIYNQNVYLENDKIVNITPDSVTISNGYHLVEAKGKYLMPGLIDMHAHVFDRTDLPQYLSYGVTTVRNMMGFPMHLRWKEQLKNGEFQGSDLITATPTINSGDDVGPFHKTIENAEEARIAAEEYLSQGYDFIKVYDGVDSLQLKAIGGVANLRGVQIAGHPPRMSLNGLLKSSISSIEHTEELLQFLDEERSEESIRKLAKQIKATNKAVTLNLVAYNRIERISLEGQPYYESLQKEYLNPVIKFIGKKQLKKYTEAGSKYKLYAEAKYKAMQNLSRIFNEEGVTILFGTDSGPNFIAAGPSVREELELLNEAGLDSYSILKSATYNASKVLNRKDLGRIVIGAKADLLLLDKNPLENFNNLFKIEQLFSNGNYYTNEDLRKVREIGEDKQSAYATIGLFLEHLINK